MKLDGKIIAQGILDSLKPEVSTLKEKGIVPTLLVVLVGDNEQSIAYIRQKEIKAKEIGARTEVMSFSQDLTYDDAKALILKANQDPLIQGIIIQRPAPAHLRVDELSEMISPEKEIDGFGANALYIVPVAEAVVVLVENAFKQMGDGGDFTDWLKKQKIVVIGKGITAGKPIISHLQKLGLNPQIIDSKTQNPKEISKNADIIISAVGKDKAVTPDMIKKNAILIGVGLHTDDEGKLRGDFHADEVRDIVSFYSSTPGGVGPVNVACLMRNLVKASKTP